MNLCRSCSEDFASFAAFDRHRTGDHQLRFPEHPGGRRCMDDREMRDAGMQLDPRGRWSIEAEAQRARERFGGLSGAPEPRPDEEEAA
jgi:hypothetical protein